MLAGLILLAALVIDAVCGDPRNSRHPVRAMGVLIASAEWLLYPGDESANGTKLWRGGLLVALVLALCYALADAALIATERLLPNSLLGIAVHTLLAGALLSLMIAPHTLARDAGEIRDLLLGGDLVEARRKLALIVSRDTDELPPADVARAVVETVAENLTDGIIAPLCWFWVGGVPLAVAYRAANTMDAMLGYRNERYLHFGRVAARLDDALNYLPARLAGLLIVAAAWLLNFDCRSAWSTMRRDANKHPSPNGGWTEAATAGALGVQLGGVNRYFGKPSHRAELGDPVNALAAEHITAAVRLVSVATWLFAAATVALWSLLMVAWLWFAVALLR